MVWDVEPTRVLLSELGCVVTASFVVVHEEFCHAPEKDHQDMFFCVH